MSSIGGRIRQAREAAGLTQQQLVEQLARRFSGIRFTQQSLSQLERGEIARTSYVVEIAMVMRINPIWLATGEGPRKLSESSVDSSMARVYSAMERMAPYERQCIARQVEAALDSDESSR